MINVNTENVSTGREITEEQGQPRLIKRNTRHSETQWAVNGSEFKFIGETIKNLPSGLYKIMYDNKNGGYKFVEKGTGGDDLLVLPYEEMNKIIRDVEYFWESQHKYSSYKYLYKRGILLYGEAGCGKSSIISLLIQKIISKYKGLVISIDTRDAIFGFIETVDRFSCIERERKLIVIFEDIDTHIEDKETLSTLLNILDGMDSIPNVVVIATTNYPEKLEQRITNRPSRFDRRYEIGKANAAIRRFYLNHKLTDRDKEKYDIEDIVRKTEGYTIDHLKEFVLSVFVLGYDIEEAYREINSINKTKILKNSSTGEVGYKKD